MLRARWLVSGSLVTALLAVAAVHAAPALARPTVLVLPLRSTDGKAGGDVGTLTDALVGHVQKSGRFQVKSMADVEAVLKHEQQRQLLGCADVACATDLAVTMQADQLITGAVSVTGTSWSISLVRLRAKDAVSLQRAQQTITPGTPRAALDKLAAMTAALLVDDVPPQLTVELRVLAQRKGASAEEVLLGGEKLRQGDRVAFEVTVTPQAYVYLVMRNSATGMLHVLFPDSQLAVQNPLPSGTRLRIPGPGDAFEVDDQDLGVEQIHLLASTREMARVGEAFQHLQGSEAAPAREQAERAMMAVVGTPAPSCQGEDCGRTRGLRLRPQGVTARLTSTPGDDAVYYTFGYQHVAANAP